jgi:hypothetical protein
MKRLFSLFILFFITGCIPVLIGTGAAVGYTLSNDSATGEIKTEYRHLWDISTDTVATMNAEIIINNESKGLIKANISGYDVTIKIDQISQGLQKLKVSARKYLMPKPHFAQKIFVKISEELK